MNVLLHICCAPCAIYPVESLREEGHAVTGFFYNPNIHPVNEYLFRLLEMMRYSARLKLKLHPGGYDIRDWFSEIRPHAGIAKASPVQIIFFGFARRRKYCEI